MDRMDEIEDVCRRMEDLCAEGGLPRFDRVKFIAHPGEVWFLWEETKLAVVVELGADPEALAESLARATAGNPVLN